jgi:hypothetical protein
MTKRAAPLRVPPFFVPVDLASTHNMIMIGQELPKAAKRYLKQNPFAAFGSFYR